MPLQETLPDTMAIRIVHSHVFRLSSSVWSYGAEVPAEIAQEFFHDNARRVLCRINDVLDVQCAIMPYGNDRWYILLNKHIRTQLELDHGSPVHLALQRDTSEYGLPMCEELAEVLATDVEASQLFHALTPGKQRSLLHWVASVKSPDKRVHRALVLSRHLVETQGKTDFKIINQLVKIQHPH